jgi:hypothetical protein
MLTWLRRRREDSRRAEADATALIAEDRLTAYSEARERQQDAHNAETFRHWGRVARAVARRNGKQIGLDTANQDGSPLRGPGREESMLVQRPRADRPFTISRHGVVSARRRNAKHNIGPSGPLRVRWLKCP